jgi:DeoR family glycerol-3-phosphate regulon repressor
MLCFKKKQKIAKMVARAIIDNFRKVFLVTDHTKIGRNAMVRLGNITEIDALFTDQTLPSVLTEVINKYI